MWRGLDAVIRDVGNTPRRRSVVTVGVFDGVHRGHQVIVVHVMDPAEVVLRGPAEARFEDPETRAGVVVRPRDWAGAFRETVEHAIAGWRLECRRRGIAYHAVRTDAPFGPVLRQVTDGRLS